MNTKPRTEPTCNIEAWFKRIKGVEFVNRSVKLFLARKDLKTNYSDKSDKHDKNEHLLACAIDSLADDIRDIECKIASKLEVKYEFDKTMMIVYSTALFFMSIATSIFLFFQSK